MTIACLERHFWENLCRMLGRDDLIPYQYAEGEKREEIVVFLREAFLKRTRDEWFELLREEKGNRMERQKLSRQSPYPPLS